MLYKNGTIPVRQCRIMFQQLRFKYKKKWVRAFFPINSNNYLLSPRTCRLIKSQAFGTYRKSHVLTTPRKQMFV